MQINSIQEFTSAACKDLKLPDHRVTLCSDLAELMGCPINASVNTSFPGRILVTDDFLSELTLAEQCAVVCHELGHLYYKHCEVRIGIHATSFAMSCILWFMPMPFVHKILGQIGIEVLNVGTQVLVYRHQELQADQMARRCGRHHDLQSDLSNIFALMHKPSYYMQLLLSVVGTFPDMEKRINALN